MEVLEAIKAFQLQLKLSNFAPKSVCDYYDEIIRFKDFLASQGINTLQEINVIHLDLYHQFLLEKNNAPSTRTKKMSVIRKFFSFCTSRNYITENPALFMEAIKVTDFDEKKKDVLSVDETVALISAVESASKDKERNVCLIKIFVYCGLRVSEVCSLLVSDINFHDKSLTVKGKGRKYRKVPLFDDLIKDLKRYLKKRDSEAEYLFTSKGTLNPLTPRSIRFFLNRYVQEAKINKSISPHSLRRTSATNFLRSGVTERYIQILLGHEHSSTTMRYMNPEVEEVMVELRKNNVVEKHIKKAKKKTRNLKQE